jgi:hypothetical protein
MNMFMVNRGFSMDKQTVLYAEMANHGQWTPEMTHDFYYTALPKRKFFSKWAKAKKSDDDIAFIMYHYQVNRRHPEEMLDLLSPQDLDEMKQDFSVGGKDKKSKAS